ncbi:MAG: zinc ribbon domain-containing protein [Lachnospiraceae bacterium]|nr:zinc ribbon domain-containing protein [Lachnospiraceae bacterium]
MIQPTILNRKGTDMFVIIGTQVKKEELGCIPEPRICPRCRRLVHYQVIREQRWFTVFWVPLFPVQSKQYIQCPSCGLALQMDEPQIDDPQKMNEPQATIPDKSADTDGASTLKKGARQAGRLAGRLKKRLDEMI